jgi:hypothetical protein
MRLIIEGNGAEFNEKVDPCNLGGAHGSTL